MRQIADRGDFRFSQTLYRCAADKQQLPYRERPHLLLYFLGKQCMYHIRLFKIAGHLGAQLVARNADVHCEAQLVTDPVLDFISQFDWIRVSQLRSRQVQEALVDGELFYGRRVGTADILKRM